ncbi:HNH endonuclease [Sphingobium yanoikuyae]|uniref:HNH endonuclease n=1 Tax=Sphingobium yanoikuyae TaxID=13690 RepID=UPI0009B82293
MRNLAKFRDRRSTAQSNCCFYCQQPIWSDDPAAFAAKFRISIKQTAYFRATAEHLIARSDGGTNDLCNIVAACLYCNSHRHRARSPLTPEAYQQRVRARLERGAWHCLHLETRPQDRVSSTTRNPRPPHKDGPKGT